MRVSVVGTGYVGLVSGACLAAIGHDVVCVDIDPTKVERINRAEPPIHEAGLPELLAELVPQRLRATTDLEQAVHDTELTLIAVGTPFDGDRIDLGAVETAAAAIGAALGAKDRYHVVVVKSTVVPGTTDGVVRPTLERSSGRTAGVDFGLAMNPEFLREGSAIEDFMSPDRIVLGALDERSAKSLDELYAPFEGVEVVHTNTRTAELIKYTANALLASLISFSNEVANLAADVGVDALDVMRGVHLDRRLTPVLEDGTRIWPGIVTYLEGGCGFGGSCFPKDVRALVAFGREHGHAMDILDAVISVNDRQPAKVLDLLSRHGAAACGARVTVLGIAFKPGTTDIRESPALALIDLLLDRDVQVTVYDPLAVDEVRDRYGDRVVYAEQLADAVDGATAIAVMTRWDEFRRLPDLLAGVDDAPVVVDGRRLLDPTSVPRYEGIGR